MPWKEASKGVKTSSVSSGENGRMLQLAGFCHPAGSPDPELAAAAEKYSSPDQSGGGTTLVMFEQSALVCHDEVFRLYGATL